MKNASETVSGFIEIATTAEMKVDTNDALAMTPKKTKQAIDWWGGLRYYAALPPVADVAEGCIVAVLKLSLMDICRCRRSTRCRSRWSP